MVCCRVRENNGSSGEPGINRPKTVTATTATAPISDASTTCPLRIRYMYKPTKSAIGMVQAMVNVPQELPLTICLHPAGRVTPRQPSAWTFSGVSAGTWTRKSSERGMNFSESG